MKRSLDETRGSRVVGASPSRALTRNLPSISFEALTAAVAAYFVLATNSAFWSGMRAAGTLSGPDAWVVVLSPALAIFALHALLLVVLIPRAVAKPALTLLLLAAAGVSYFSKKYSVYIDPSMIRNVLRTDATEAGELLTLDLGVSLLLFGALPSLLVWLVRIHVRPLRVALMRRMLFAFAMIVLTAASLFVAFDDLSPLMRNHPSLRYMIAPGNVLVATTKVLAERAREPEGPRQVVGADAKLQGHTASTKPHFLVIVVGETARAQNWGLNGYGRQTTPQLARLDVVNYKDVSACGSNTEVSVPCMFSSTGRRRYDQQRISNSDSLLHVLERAAVRTLWRDNQTGCKGVCEGLPFQSYRKPPKDPMCNGEACRDAVMLQGLHDAIDDNPGDVVVVLHQIGNHGPSYYKRYGDEFRRFLPDCREADLKRCSRGQIVNAYDNAILATDDFLAKAIRMLAQDASHDTALIYLSDHGESLGENNIYLHGFPYAIAPDTQIKVPMVAWLSPGMIASTGIDMRCVRARADQPASHDNLFHSVLGLMQVTTAVYEPALDLFGSCATPRPQVSVGLPAGQGNDLNAPEPDGEPL
ncbi:MAG TPA: phosphoethanolamine--lipid A transferase [Xanthomonadaceae bacterium]|jgi:lipid A ethanolaminephosphotransferase